MTAEATPNEMENENFVNLRHYVERIVAHQHEVMENRFIAIDKALEKAEASMNSRLENMNEFRRQLEAQEKRYAQVSELKSLEEKIDIRLTRLERAESIMSGKTAVLGAVILLVIAGASAAIKLVF